MTFYKEVFCNEKHCSLIKETREYTKSGFSRPYRNINHNLFIQRCIIEIIFFNVQNVLRNKRIVYQYLIIVDSLLRQIKSQACITRLYLRGRQIQQIVYIIGDSETVRHFWQRACPTQSLFIQSSFIEKNRKMRESFSMPLKERDTISQYISVHIQTT